MSNRFRLKRTRTPGSRVKGGDKLRGSYNVVSIITFNPILNPTLSYIRKTSIQLFSGTLYPNTSIYKNKISVLIGYVTFNGAIQKQTSRIIASSFIIPSSRITRSVIKYLTTAVLSPNFANMTKYISRIVGGRLSPSLNGMSKAITRSLSGTLSPLFNNIYKSMTRNIYSTFTPIFNGISKGVSTHILGSTLYTNSRIIRSYTLVLSGSVYYIGSALRKTSKYLSTSTTATLFLIGKTSKTIGKSLSSNIVIGLNSIKKNITLSVFSSFISIGVGSFTKFYAKAITALISPVGIIGRSVMHGMTASLINPTALFFKVTIKRYFIGTTAPTIVIPINKRISHISNMISGITPTRSTFVLMTSKAYVVTHVITGAINKRIIGQAFSGLYKLSGQATRNMPIAVGGLVGFSSGITGPAINKVWSAILQGIADFSTSSTVSIVRTRFSTPHRQLKLFADGIFVPGEAMQAVPTILDNPPYIGSKDINIGFQVDIANMNSQLGMIVTNITVTATIEDPALETIQPVDVTSTFIKSVATLGNIVTIVVGNGSQPIGAYYVVTILITYNNDPATTQQVYFTLNCPA